MAGAIPGRLCGAAVLDVIEQEKLLQRADAVGARIKAESFQKRVAEQYLDAHGRDPGVPAPWVDFEIVKERGGVLDPEATKLLTERALALGLVVLLLRRLGMSSASGAR